MSMSESRLEKLEAMLLGEPDDPFLRYSRAMELEKIGRHDESIAAFSTLLEDDPSYVPAYFMVGQLLARLGRRDEASDYLLRGIEQARESGDAHAVDEMTQFLDNLKAIDAGGG